MMEGLVIQDHLELLGRFGISLFRTSGLMILLPILGSHMLPRKFRIWIAIALTVVMFPLIPEGLVRPQGVVEWTVLGVREILIGFFMGLAARALFSSVELASRLISGQSGFALAQMMDPITGGQSMAPALFTNLLVTALFLAADLHHLFIHALRSSYEIVPPAVTMFGFSNLDQSASLLGARLFTIAVQLAAPGLVIAFAMDLLIAIVGRTMSRVPIILVAFPAKLALGIVSMMLLAVILGSAIRSLGRTIASDTAVILSALAGS
jgi:flagellar biosynthetic protein FliR